jgi:hypothetical protein
VKFYESDENLKSLSLVQGLLSNITQQMRAVSIAVTSDHVAIWFFVSEMDPETKDAIDDAICEFDALTEGGYDLDVKIETDARPLGEFPNRGRFVFARLEPG